MFKRDGMTCHTIFQKLKRCVDFSVFCATVTAIGFFIELMIAIRFSFSFCFTPFSVAFITTFFNRFFNTAYGLRRELEFLNNLFKCFS